MLTPQAELELFYEYQGNNNIEARDALVHNCLRQVIKIARRYSRDPHVIKDLISAGNFGILDALERYEPDRGTRFLSYATYYILLRIREELQDSDVVSTPRWRQKAVRKINKIKNAAAREGKQLEDEDICVLAELSRAQLERLKIERLHFPPIETVSPPRKKPDVDISIMSAEMKNFLGAALKTLRVKECFVLLAYYGFIDEPWSLKQIATLLGVSSERVRQIKTGALDSLHKKFSKNLRVMRIRDIAVTE